MKLILSFFASLKVAILLICFLTLLSIVGTFIPQGLEAINYIKGFPNSWWYILKLGFDDMYRSPLFLSVLFLLSVSAIVCVSLRWKNVYKQLFNKIDGLTSKDIQNLKVIKKINGKPDEDKLKKYNFYTLNDGRKVGLLCSGKSALIGGLILHIGLVLIFIGGFIGLLFGVEMSIYGKAGEKIPVPSIEVIRKAYKADKLSRKARTIRQFNPEDSRLGKMREEIEGLHKIYNEGIMHPEFKVSFEKLWMEHYTNASGTNDGVKSWNAQLKFMDVASGSLFETTNESNPVIIKVNEPVSYKQLSFYLANWNKNWERITLDIDYFPNVKGWEDYKPDQSLFPQSVDIAVSEPFEIKGFPYSLVISSFFPDFKIANGNIFNVSNELKNPAAIMIAFDKEANCEVGHTWAFSEDKASMSAHVSNLPLKFTFKKAKSNYECTLQMTYDPGKPLVWIGCLLFCLGMMFTFYVSYQEEWIIYNLDGSISIALRSNRSEEVLKNDLEEFEKKLINKNKEANI